MTATPDIVERLRCLERAGYLPLIKEAADEIERLRVACAGGLTVAGRMTDECVKLRAVIIPLMRAILRREELLRDTEIELRLWQADASGASL